MAPFPQSGYLIFATSVPWVLLAPLGCDDLAPAELASIVVGSSSFSAELVMAGVSQGFGRYLAGIDLIGM